jgi:hypothetical protein
VSFHKQSFETRFGAMGDEAEAVFDEMYPKHHKLGLNRPPFQVAGMDAALRYLPDRMLRDRFVECMGIGRDRLLKPKVEKFEALFRWTWIAPVDLFVYDKTKQMTYMAPLRDWWESCSRHGIADTFPEGKEYVGLHVDHFPVPPTPRTTT